MASKISGSDIVGVLTGVLSLVLLYINPAPSILGLVSNGLGILAGTYSGFWLILRIKIYYSGPYMRAKPGLFGDSLAINLSSTSTVFLDTAHFLYFPDNIRLIQIPDDADKKQRLSQEVKIGGEEFEWRNTKGLIRPTVYEDIFDFEPGYFTSGGNTKIGLEINDNSWENEPIIYLLWIKLNYRIKPSDVSFIPLPDFFNWLYGPFPVKPVEYRYENEMPRVWERGTGPERIQPPYSWKWPDFPNPDD